MGVSPDEWRELIGQHIERRRRERRLSVRGAAELAGFSEGQWRQMESGVRTVAAGQFVTVNPRPSTRASASTALGWSIDSIDRLEHGLDPIEEQPGDHPAVVAQVAEQGLRLEQLAADVQRLDGIVDRLQSRVDQFVTSESSARAAEGATGLPPIDRGQPLPRPQPTPEGGDHIAD